MEAEKAAEQVEQAAVAMAVVVKGVVTVAWEA